MIIFFFHEKAKGHILSSTNPYKNTLTEIEKYIQILEAVEVFFLLIHRRRAVSKARCRLWVSVSTEQTCLIAGACRSGAWEVADVDQKTPTTTICVANRRPREENAGEGL